MTPSASGAIRCRWRSVGINVSGGGGYSQGLWGAASDGASHLDWRSERRHCEHADLDGRDRELRIGLKALGRL
jgi:hypothetical protein